jgi:hypothetical protein
MQHKPWIESTLRELGFVEWDRYYSYGSDLAFFGWIDREDQYKDFVVVVLDNQNRLIRGYHTSSAEYTEKIAEILDIGHSECQRVEDMLAIDNMVEVEE